MRRDAREKLKNTAGFRKSWISTWMSNEEENKTKLTEVDFMRMFLKHENALRAFARSLLPDWDAVDLLYAFIELRREPYNRHQSLFLG